MRNCTKYCVHECGARVLVYADDASKLASKRASSERMRIYFSSFVCQNKICATFCIWTIWIRFWRCIFIFLFRYSVRSFVRSSCEHVCVPMSVSVTALDNIRKPKSKENQMQELYQQITQFIRTGSSVGCSALLVCFLEWCGTVCVNACVCLWMNVVCTYRIAKSMYMTGITKRESDTNNP